METQTGTTRLITRKRITLVSSFCVLMLPMVVMADVCTYEKAVELTLPAADVEHLIVTAGPGSLEVFAAATDDVVRVTGTLCASRIEELRDLAVIHGSKETTLQIATQIPEIHSAFWISHRPYIDLQVQLPAGMAVSIVDESGDLSVQGTGDLVIIDTSGGIDVRAIAGDVVIKDGSGELSVADVDGRVDIHDGSGDITVQDVAMQAAIHEDGSGDVDMRRVNVSVATEFADGNR